MGDTYSGQLEVGEWHSLITMKILRKADESSCISNEKQY